MKRQQITPKIFTEIDLNQLIAQLMEKQKISLQKPFPRPPISLMDYEFAKEIIEMCVLSNLRSDNFCIDLANRDLETWTSIQYRAFAKLYVAFVNKASEHLKLKQENGKNIADDAQLFWLKLPKQHEKNRKAVNSINKILLNHGFEDFTGNENAVTLLKYINTQKKNPVVPFVKTNTSVSVVIIVEKAAKNYVLFLKRGGRSARENTWGTLTGTIERDDATNEDTLLREVHEEINILLENKKAHYVGSFHTKDMSKDLVAKGTKVSYADDCSYVYGVKISEKELTSAIKLDEENSNWKLFGREELCEQFKVHNFNTHGHAHSEEMHVAAAKALLVLNCATNNFDSIEHRKFNYPYTDSPGFFVNVKASHSEAAPAQEDNFKYD